MNNVFYDLNKEYSDLVEGKISIKIVNKSKSIVTLKIPAKKKLSFHKLEWSSLVLVNFQKYHLPGSITLFGQNSNFVVGSDLFYYSLNALQGGFYYDNTGAKYFSNFPWEWLHTRAYKTPFDFGTNKWRLKIKFYPIGKNMRVDGLVFMLGPNSNILDGLGLYLLAP